MVESRSSHSVLSAALPRAAGWCGSVLAVPLTCFGDGDSGRKKGPESTMLSGPWSFLGIRLARVIVDVGLHRAVPFEVSGEGLDEFFVEAHLVPSHLSEHEHA